MYINNNQTTVATHTTQTEQKRRETRRQTDRDRETERQTERVLSVIGHTDIPHHSR